jgi:hypothetical protein
MNQRAELGAIRAVFRLTSEGSLNRSQLCACQLGSSRQASTGTGQRCPRAVPARRVRTSVRFFKAARSAGTKTSGPWATSLPKAWGHGGFDKGTLAMAQIGPVRAGQKPARSRRQRTGYRPLSNPPLRPCQSSSPPPVPADTDVTNRYLTLGPCNKSAQRHPGTSSTFVECAIWFVAPL